MLLVRCLILFLLLGIQSLTAQNTPFNRGVNLTEWFQADNAQQIQFNKYTKQDFEQIKSLGCDVIRLPIRLHSMTNGAPDYTLDPLFLNFLDQVTDWAVDLNMHLIYDNHSFDPDVNTDPAIGPVLEKIWLQMAQHFKSRPNLIYYEILNEPHDISNSLWGSIQQDVINTIRSVDSTHAIIVGTAGWNGYKDLDELPEFDDDNLIYTFHFCDPYLFTHQGASWVHPSMEAIAGIPFPYNAAEMPSLPVIYEGTWVEASFNSYEEVGTVEVLQEWLDLAVQFRDQRQVPVFCGQFGTLMDKSDNEDRNIWYQTIRQYLDDHNISWTMWDYHGGFGLFEAGTEGLFDHDLNVSMLQALGLNVPPQTPLVIVPDSTGFMIYDDYVSASILESSNSTGTLSFYASNEPHNGNYCIHWAGASQYQKIGLDFRPNRDLSYLVDQKYALDFYVRGDSPGASFDVRFVDSDVTDPGWRIRVKISNSLAAWDQQWHHLHLPLVHFTEGGAWYNDTFYNATGDFDWATIDHLEIVAEQGSLQGVNFWFDQIQITELDSTLITYLDEAQPADVPELLLFPNPVSDVLTVKTTAEGECKWQLADQLGRVAKEGVFTESTAIYLTELPGGVYFFKWTDGKHGFFTKKLVKV